MKKLALTVICTLCFGFAQAQYDNWAVGFKLGEPTGINIRKYFNNINAIDVTVGTYGVFKEKYRSNKVRPNVGLSVQAHYLWHNPLFNSENVRVYYGLGAQVNSRAYDRMSGNVVTEKVKSAISLGGSALGGVEYFIPENRISVFLEGGTYVELAPSPLFFSPNISGGVRFNL
jgi:hypothetical protein